MEKRSILLNKLVLPAVVIISVITVTFAALSLVYIRRTALTTGTNAQFEQIGQMLVEMEAQLDRLDNIAYLIMNEPRLITMFSNLAVDGDSKNYFRTDLVADIEYTTILAAFNQSSPPVWRISVYNNKGDFLSTGAMCDYDRVRKRLGSMDVTALMNEAAKDPLSHSVLLYKKDVWNTAFNSNYVIMRCPLMNIYSNVVYGIVELTLDVSAFEHLIEPYRTEHGLCVTVTDSNGSEITGSGTIEQTGNIVTQIRSEKYGWTVTASKSIAEILRPYHLLNVMVVVCGMLIAAIAVAVIYRIASNTLRPLAQLKETVRSVSFTEHLPEDGGTEKIDEVKELDAAFSEMLSRLNNSMMLEKKATMLAMQSQMHPHFLYNMLAVIGAAGSESGSPKVETLCCKLSEMLRYSASYEHMTVTLYDELRHLNAYLELMKARYEDFLVYTVDFPPEMYKLTVPKLFLQPIVENSFSHGFAGSEPPYELLVKGETEGTHWKITISDNGAGFTAEQRDFVVERVRHLEQNISEKLSSTSIGGLGLASAVLRLRLVSGKPVTFDICDNTPHGARICLEGEM